MARATAPPDMRRARRIRRAPSFRPSFRPGGTPAPRRMRPILTDQSALSVMAWVQAPSGSLVITGSEPPASSDFTVRS